MGVLFLPGFGGGEVDDFVVGARVLQPAIVLVALEAFESLFNVLSGGSFAFSQVHEKARADGFVFHTFGNLDEEMVEVQLHYWVGG
eukprot:evm.model.NODE_24645_length_22151_cov_27.466434.5